MDENPRCSSVHYRNLFMFYLHDLCWKALHQKSNWRETAGCYNRHKASNLMGQVLTLTILAAT